VNIQKHPPRQAAPADPVEPSSLTSSPSVPQESYELRVLQALRRIIQAIDIHSRKLAQQHDITGPQLVCLHELHNAGPRTVSGLAKSIYLSPSTMVGIVDRLEEKGLVARMRDLQDRRKVVVALTDAGRIMLERAPSPMQDRLAESLGRLAELEQVSITLSLEKIVQLMEAEEIDAAPLLETGPLSPRKIP